LAPACAALTTQLAVAAPGEQDERHLARDRMAAHRVQQTEPIHLRHVKVTYDEVERLAREAVFMAALPFLRFVDVPDADLLQRHARHLTHAVLIVDNEQP